MKNNINYTLYLVTDRQYISTKRLEDCIEQAIIGGCTIVQIREKEASSLEFYEIALRAREVTTQYKTPLIINDRLDIALAVKADGVHVGQSDLPIDIVRKIVGEDMVVGLSVSTLAEALIGVEQGADYLGVGIMFATQTKTDGELVSIEELKAIRANVNVPIVVIGSINKDTIPQFKGTGIDGIAVVSAILAEKDMVGATARLKEMFLGIDA